MPKLVDMDIVEISGVDKAANRKKFLIIKREEGGETLNKGDEPTKRENGYDFPASAFAYVPDPEKPSTWKLRLWETPETKETARQVGMAVAALGPGFRGNKVEIPAEDLPKVKAKVRAAWRKVNPDKSDDEMPDAIKKDDEATLKDKLWGFVKGLFGKEQKEEHEDNSDIQKISDELAKAGRAISAQRLTMLKQMQDLLAQLIADGEKYLAETGASDAGVAKTKKEDDGMLIPEEIKKKLPDDVKKQVEELEKKAQETEQLKAKVAELEKKLAEKDQPNKDDDIWKGVNPEIRKQMEELKKEAEEAKALAKKEREERITKEFIAKAAAFQGLPVKPEEFGPVLKSLAEKDPEVYTKIEGVLKAADEAITKGALFKELGRASYGDEGSALAKLEAKAEEIRKSDSKLTKEQAFVKACEENPELYAQYRREVM